MRQCTGQAKEQSAISYQHHQDRKCRLYGRLSQGWISKRSLQCCMFHGFLVSPSALQKALDKSSSVDFSRTKVA